ncbi:MarR family winged helix-turn-helix transcriptional regulator [Alterisphingorhabdus coralli]|uniref:MarR family winged helix-turn-helix transcriptional regulator n=1 Tax=Alterisphingorhabdus coralli TaxID=3071408 RepID=A0AA97F5B9_9SPHN|nr:MarR family winged helix-turn-helix transcriptional regulator [Parasphingorhabdus sp. SCSIO 66989]WOE74624.1 MarR family winged helix-turn-helix transcriptional regulator [Parasphingorhabdus sp. SCSIO 66989]
MAENDRTRLADFLPYQLSITTNAVSNLIAEEYRSRFGLKITEWRIMAVLGDLEQATQRELVAVTRMDKVAVNRACKALVERKLIARAPHASDGRSHQLALTATGAELYGEIMPLAEDMERRIFAVLSSEEETQMRDMLTRLREASDALRDEE